MTKPRREWVTCSICDNRFVGIVPKGGDGSVLRPRKHNRGSWGRFGRVVNEVCPGSYRLAKEFEHAQVKGSKDG